MPAKIRDRLIAQRVRHMLDSGWIAEVKALIAQGFSDSRAMRSVGYKQIFDALAAGDVQEDKELEASIYRATRVFARRQRTWLRDQPDRV